MSSGVLKLDEMLRAEYELLSLRDMKAAPGWDDNYSGGWDPRSKKPILHDAVHCGLSRIEGFTILFVRTHTEEPRLSQRYYILYDNQEGAQEGVALAPGDGMGWLRRKMEPDEVITLNKIVNLCNEVFTREDGPKIRSENPIRMSSNHHAGL